MPNTLHVDYELKTYDESMKIVEEAMKIARQEIPKGNSIAGCRLLREISNKLRLSLFYDTEFMKAKTKDYSLTQKKEHC